LISGQHYSQGKHPLKETLSSIAIQVAPVESLGGSGLGWLVYMGTGKRYLQFTSLVICLMLPLLASAVSIWLAASAWLSRRGLAEWLVPQAIRLSAIGMGALVLAWAHQFDFSSLVFEQDPSAFRPGAGFWLALCGCVIVFVGSMRLRSETRRDVVNWWALVFAVILLIWLLVRAKPYPFLEIWDFVLDGIFVTLRIVGTSFGLILLVSLLGGLGRISRIKIIYGVASLYVEIVRGIPLLVQLLFIWFALPQIFDVVGELLLGISPVLATAGQSLIDLRLDPFTAAVVGLTVCYGAYGSEIFRAGISSIHHGQSEAARSLGMNYFQAMRYVILPQALRVILPPVGNEFVALLKDSSLVSVLAVSDLTRRGREYMARTFLSFDTWIMVALCYLVLTLFSSRVVEYIEFKSSSKR